MEMPAFPKHQDVIARQIEPLLARGQLTAAESSHLAALRDALLPKLISGELRVVDAERRHPDLQSAEA